MTRRATLRVVAAEPDDNGQSLAALIDERDRMARDIAALDDRIAAGCRTYSYARGYRCPLRPHQVRRMVRGE